MCKIAGVCLGVGFLIYCEGTRCLKHTRKIIRFCLEKVYKILRCTRFLLQENVIESAKMITEIKAIKRPLFELLRAKDNATQRVNNNPGNVRGPSNQYSKTKSNK